MALQNSTNYFDPLNTKEELKNRIISGGFLVVGTQICKFILKLLSLIVLARLLTPEDFGLIAMVAAIINFVSMFKDMGLSMATVQQAEITHEQVSILFWINLVVGCGLTILTIIIAPIISLFYGIPKLTYVCIIISLGFIVSSVSVQHQALLVRKMRYRILALVEILSSVVGIILAITAAWQGLSYWSLVIMQLSTGLIMSIGFWIACDWRPGLPVRGTRVRSLLYYGGNLTGFSVINYFSRNLDNLLIGKYWGPHQLGLYDRAYQLMLLPISHIITPISGVAVTVLSRLQDDPERFKKYYFGALNLIAFIICPLVVVMAVMSKEIVLLLLGSQWIGSSLIFKALAFVVLIQPLSSTLGWVYQSLGKTNRLLQWGMISTPIYIISFIIGLPWGANGVAIAYAVCCYILLLPSISYAFKGTKLKMSHFFQSIICPIVISLFVYPILKFYYYSMYFLSPLLFLVGSVLSVLLSISVAMIIWPRARGELMNILDTYKEYRYANS